jgi:hypothetical protein
MPMGKPVPAMDPYTKLPPIPVAQAVATNKTGNTSAAGDGYKGQSK